jgi:hypothetical protein
MSRQYTLQRSPVPTSIHVDYAAELNRPKTRHVDSCLNQLITDDFSVLLGAARRMIRAISLPWLLSRDISQSQLSL